MLVAIFNPSESEFKIDNDLPHVQTQNIYSQLLPFEIQAPLEIDVKHSLGYRSTGGISIIAVIHEK